MNLALFDLSDVSARTARLREVTGILNKHDLLPTSRANPDTLPERLHAALLEVGPTGVKLGQFLAQRPDLVSPEVVSQLGSLHADVPPEPSAVSRRTFEEETGQTIDTAFASFWPEPIASGSVGQVFHARLHDGRAVVVKIRREGALESCRVDLLVLRDVARMAGAFGMDEGMGASDIAQRFSEAVLAELDFRQEAAHLRWFHDFFEDDDRVEIPEVVDALSTEAVLTMTRLEGVPIADEPRIEMMDVDRGELASRGVDLVLQMIRAGRFHADPHPGNLLLYEDGRVGLVDFGMVGHLSPEARRHLMRGVSAFLDNDARRCAKALRRVCKSHKDVDTASLERDLQVLLDRYGAMDLADLPVQDVLLDSVAVLREHGLELGGDNALLLRCLLLLDGTARRIDADVNLVEAISRSQATGMPDGLADLLPPLLESGAGSAARSVFGSVDALLDVPEDVGGLLEVVRDGRLAVKVSLEGLDGAVHRLTWATVSAALLLGGCVLLAAEVAPVVLGISLFGLFLLLTGSVSSIALLVSIALHHLGRKSR